MICTYSSYYSCYNILYLGHLQNIFLLSIHVFIILVIEFLYRFLSLFINCFLFLFSIPGMFRKIEFHKSFWVAKFHRE